MRKEKFTVFPTIFGIVSIAETMVITARMVLGWFEEEQVSLVHGSTSGILLDQFILIRHTLKHIKYKYSLWLIVGVDTRKTKDTEKYMF